MVVVFGYAVEVSLELGTSLRVVAFAWLGVFTGGTRAALVRRGLRGGARHDRKANR